MKNKKQANANQLSLYKKFIKYQTLANQCIEDIAFHDMNISTQINVAKNFLHIEQYKKSYELLHSIENSIGKNNIHNNEIKRLQGIALFRMKQRYTPEYAFFWKKEKLPQNGVSNRFFDYFSSSSC